MKKIDELTKEELIDELFIEIDRNTRGVVYKTILVVLKHDFDITLDDLFEKYPERFL